MPWLIFKMRASTLFLNNEWWMVKSTQYVATHAVQTILKHLHQFLLTTISYLADEQTGEVKQDGVYVEVRHPKSNGKKSNKAKDSKTDNQKQQSSDAHHYVNVSEQSTLPASETLPSTDTNIAISTSYDQSPQEHISESIPVSPHAQSVDPRVVTLLQQDKRDSTDVNANVNDVCLEQPVQKFKPTPKPRKKMNQIPVQGETFMCIWNFVWEDQRAKECIISRKLSSALYDYSK